ncbi:hypothetical protein GE21DRAFT_1324924 [Neurospora crassa]|nr:hypothetical protein GE21DRAFT_1324924 [Neurospora crassa]
MLKMWPDTKTSIIRTHHTGNSHTLLDRQPTRSHTCFPTAPGISHLATTGLWQPIAVQSGFRGVEVWNPKCHSFPLLAHTMVHLYRSTAMLTTSRTMGNTLEHDKSRTLHASGAPGAIPDSAGEPVHAGHAGPGLQPAVRPVLVQFLAGPACLLMADVGQVLRNTSQGHDI